MGAKAPRALSCCSQRPRAVCGHVLLGRWSPKSLLEHSRPRGSGAQGLRGSALLERERSPASPSAPAPPPQLFRAALCPLGLCKAKDFLWRGHSCMHRCERRWELSRACSQGRGRWAGLTQDPRPDA